MFKASFFLICLIVGCQTAIAAPVKIGSKAFNESYILAEMAALLLEHHDIAVERKLGLGGTLIAFEALKNNEIAFYPEYTGTISQVILKSSDNDIEHIRQQLQKQELQLLEPFGFNNSYAIAITNRVAEETSISTISDFAQYPDLRIAVSLEFLNREDGWPALSQAYQLNHDVTGIEHALAYQAMENGQLDATDAYTTDGDIESFPIALLQDDRKFFPEYLAAFLSRDDLPIHIQTILDQLSGRIDEQAMRDMTSQVSMEQKSPVDVAEQFLLEQRLIDAPASRSSWPADILRHTLTHLQLTLTALILAIIVAIPTAIQLSRYDTAAKSLLYVTGLFQTIPALALLALLIPFVGLGKVTAIVALFLYSLLPIFRNTLTGLSTVDPILKQVATGMGLTHRQQMLRIELPLAAPTIIAGIKTAAIISIGTATLAAFVGAGGLGEPIITGLTLNDHSLILQGAIPAAALAIIIELLFERIESKLQPQHLR